MTFYKIPTVQDSIISVYYILSNGKLQMIGDVAHDYLRELQKAKQLRIFSKMCSAESSPDLYMLI